MNGSMDIKALEYNILLAIQMLMVIWLSEDLFQAAVRLSPQAGHFCQMTSALSLKFSQAKKLETLYTRF